MPRQAGAERWWIMNPFLAGCIFGLVIYVIISYVARFVIGRKGGDSKAKAQEVYMEPSAYLVGREENVDLLATIQRLKQENERLKKELLTEDGETAIRISDLENKNARSKARIDELALEKDRLKKENAELEARVAELEATVEEFSGRANGVTWNMVADLAQKGVKLSRVISSLILNGHYVAFSSDEGIKKMLPGSMLTREGINEIVEILEDALADAKTARVLIIERDRPRSDPDD